MSGMPREAPIDGLFQRCCRGNIMGVPSGTAIYRRDGVIRIRLRTASGHSIATWLCRSVRRRDRGISGYNRSVSDSVYPDNDRLYPVPRCVRHVLRHTRGIFAHVVYRYRRTNRPATPTKKDRHEKKIMAVAHGGQEDDDDDHDSNDGDGRRPFPSKMESESDDSIYVGATSDVPGVPVVFRKNNNTVHLERMNLDRRSLTV